MRKYSKRKSNRGFVIIGLTVITGLILALIFTAALYYAGIISVGGKIKDRTLTAAETESVRLPPKESSAPNGTEDPAVNAAISDTPKTAEKKIIILDPGHGKSSSAMSADEKKRDGWLYNNQKGGWGEWRHRKSGSAKDDCYGSGCSGRAPQNGGCWYPISAGDRDKEPQINLNNTLAAKKYLEQMGYEVRITRSDNNTNPSMTERLKYCYSGKDTTQPPDADAFVSIHSNAGGGRGSCYIALSGVYDQAGISSDYVSSGNRLGKAINDRITAETQLSAAGDGGRYDGYPTLILFCKSPITIAYLEIGFYDNAADLDILNNSSDKIGKAIAEGINDYMTN